MIKNGLLSIRFLLLGVVLAFIIAVLTTPAADAKDKVTKIEKDGKQYVCKETEPDCKPKVVYKTRYRTKTKKVYVDRVVEQTEHVNHRNRISLTAGHGAKGNMVCNGSSCETEQGTVVGLQGMRDFWQEEDFSVHMLLQIQTNKTLQFGMGVGF